MPNCRSIPPEKWAEAREALVFYFSRRHGSDRAEDLAHATLAAVLSREDYVFENVADFPRVCLGFARLVSQSGYRETKRQFEQVRIEDDAASPKHHAGGVHAIEDGILLAQITKLGESQLPESDWNLLLRVSSAGSLEAVDPAEANRLRVSLHRARKKLERITGWRR